MHQVSIDIKAERQLRQGMAVAGTVRDCFVYQSTSKPKGN